MNIVQPGHCAHIHKSLSYPSSAFNDPSACDIYKLELTLNTLRNFWPIDPSQKNSLSRTLYQNANGADSV